MASGVEKRGGGHAKGDEESGGTRPWSYSSMPMSVAARFVELGRLAFLALLSTARGVDITLATMRAAEQRIVEHTGVRLHNLRVLEIGPGQCPHRSICMSINNQVVGIDTDIIPQSLRFDEYLRMIRHSPVIRSVKTIGRKILARDARANAVLRRRLGVQRLPRPEIRQMSATRMSFSDDSFSLVCSWSVFEHIDDPVRAVREVVRVLRPGGVAYISVHLYTSHSGQHDAAAFTPSGSPRPPFWPHLRAAYKHTVEEATYLNRLRLAEWRALFEETMPGVVFVTEQDEALLADALERLRKSGELAGYADEELLTINLIAIWKKPSETSISPQMAL